MADEKKPDEVEIETLADEDLETVSGGDSTVSNACCNVVKNCGCSEQ